MGVLSRKDVEGIKDIVPMLVKDVPGWNGDIYVRGLSAAEEDAYNQSNLSYETVKDEKGEDKIKVVRRTENIRARMVVLGACDEAGNRLFADEDAEWVGKKGTLAVAALYDKICDLSGRNIRQKDVEKNSGSGQSESSS